MAKFSHSGGLVDAVIEMGFDTVKYFEITANGTAQAISFTLPARRLTLRNKSTTDPFYFNITGTTATTSVSATPGDDIKVGSGCTFSMDFDSFTTISIITGGANVLVEGVIGWQGLGIC